MYESTKTKLLRGPGFYKTYFSGTVLDIGSGFDVVVPHARPFDQEQGDANNILDYIQPHSFDTVNSSHCLEHMHAPEQVLQDWWQLVKPGGYLITVVPHEDLYEQGQWPSRFNSDHKATFRLNRSSSWSPCSFDLLQMSESLPGAEVIAAEIQDDNYNYDIMSMGEESENSRIIRLRHSELLHQLLSKNLCSMPVLDELNIFMANLGATVDQTIGSALAQIQVVVRKMPEEAQR